jgi:alkylation response protein AidB-like acyl-CoA dehydrogenase
MQFGLSESQEILRDSARKFFAGECPMDQVRKLMETPTAYDEKLWAKLAEQGYTGIIFPEKFGGVGLGQVELILLMEEAGRALLPGPFFSTVPLAGAVLDAVASDEHKKKYLEPICEGKSRATVAILEASASWDLADVQLKSSGSKLSGADGHGRAHQCHLPGLDRNRHDAADVRTRTRTWHRAQDRSA